MSKSPSLEDKVAAAEIKYTQRPYFTADTIAKEAGFANAKELDQACQQVRGKTFVALREELKKQDEKTAPDTGSNNLTPGGYRKQALLYMMVLELSGQIPPPPEPGGGMN